MTILADLVRKWLEKSKTPGADAVPKPSKRHPHDRGYEKALARRKRQPAAGEALPGIANDAIPKPTLHIGVDAAFQQRGLRPPKAGVGIHLQEISLGIALPIRAAISSEAEAVGIWLSLHLAERLGMSPHISSDNQSVAESIAQRKLTSGRWRSDEPLRTPLFASRIIHEARTLRVKLGAQVEWTEREENHLPHLLAALGVRHEAVLVFLPRDVVLAEEELVQHKFRSEPVARVMGALPVDLPREGLAWQDWTTQRYLDALAARVRALAGTAKAGS